MYNGKQILAIIPARGGSKGIPQKNIKNVNGKPLIQYSIDEAKSSLYLDEIVVSTDCKKIGEISKALGVSVPFIRPDRLADDHAKTIDVVIHAIDFFNKLKRKFDYIVVLQPTQPLRKSWHIDQAIERIIESNEESLVSITEVTEHPLLMRVKKHNDILENLLNMSSTVRRQELEKYYKVNGAIYINKVNSNLNHLTSLNDNKLGYEMDVRYDIDIDRPRDLQLLRFLLTSGLSNSSKEEL